MSEPPRVVSSVMDVAESESRPVVELRKPVVKPKSKEGKREEVKKSSSSVAMTVNLSLHSKSITPLPLSVFRRKDCKMLKSNFSMIVSCSSDASSDSSHSRASIGRISRRSVTSVRGKESAGLRTGKVENGFRIVSKVGKVESETRGEKVENVVEIDGSLEASGDALLGRKRCPWVTTNTRIILSKTVLFNLFSYRLCIAF
ncbi:hypothetical protein Hanom_Chr03g00232391 [Helianthus anomalus]